MHASMTGDTVGSDAPAVPAHNGRNDFDFLFGRWHIHNRKLVRRLENCTDWHEFGAQQETKPILDGLGNIDRVAVTSLPPEGRPFHATAVRLFSPQTQLWRIWWMSTALPGHMDIPVVGRFVNGIGQFICEDLFNDQPIILRFRWSDITIRSAHWEQAFSTDAGATWETNWTMDFTRVE